eukprot:TRINITY_DN12738_c0_g1_i1.p1 TRINITY_DN12738_c0_g1~~TRINITY_DN12738_c0_g1_i1.p1  ORF type:complete len:387 (+),score=11.89 TRINITY_DN12738_c0_g1_i1:63-1223(+)
MDKYTDNFFNYRFLLGNIKSLPDGDFVHNIHKWSYDKLERHHGYIQWLFPIPRSRGINSYSFELTLQEAILISENYKCRINILNSYKIMLDFYGIELVNSVTGELQTTINYNERIEHLFRHPHNNLRITRIIISMSCLGFLKYSTKFIEFLYEQVYIIGTLFRCKYSFDRYWNNSLSQHEYFYTNVKQVPQSLFYSLHNNIDNEVATIKDHIKIISNTLSIIYSMCIKKDITQESTYKIHLERNESDSLSSIDHKYIDCKFRRVCVKVKYLRQGSSGSTTYDNLRDWLDCDKNYLATRPGRVFIDKVPYHYKGSILGNPYTIKKYGREECLSRYLNIIKTPTDEMLKELHYLINSDIKYIGCYCEPEKSCHIDILIQKLGELNNVR